MWVICNDTVPVLTFLSNGSGEGEGLAQRMSRPGLVSFIPGSVSWLHPPGLVDSNGVLVSSHILYQMTYLSPTSPLSPFLLLVLTTEFLQTGSLWRDHAQNLIASTSEILLWIYSSRLPHICGEINHSHYCCRFTSRDYQPIHHSHTLLSTDFSPQLITVHCGGTSICFDQLLHLWTLADCFSFQFRGCCVQKITILLFKPL